MTASDGAKDDYFGFDISLEGKHLLVGAMKLDSSTQDGGAVYSFEKKGRAWKNRF